MLGLWKMSEALTVHPDLLVEARHLFRSSARQREYVCVRLLLREMLGREDFSIQHLETGKPLLVGDPRTLSISHTRGYCAVLLTNACGGVDIEMRNPRVDNVADRYMRPDENADSTTARLAIWCAKETIYKMFSEEELHFMRMKIVLNDDFHRLANRHEYGNVLIRGYNLLREVEVPIYCELTKDYVLTYSIFQE